ncbi:hypothetical protein F5B20DRAFT_518014 [Whalleya microplaca]|nr:hypothetical protein F5B20DRAFT_518014 [Whalleya microplaca]
MKTTFITFGTFMLASIASGAVSPASLPMGIQIVEREGIAHVREVLQHDTRAAACRDCKDDGQGCTIGDGSCHPNSYCTWCGNHCKSICIPGGDSSKCVDYCL